MDYEDQRSMRENLDEETLAIYDLLRKETLTKENEKLVKKVAKETLQKLKQEKLNINNMNHPSNVKHNSEKYYFYKHILEISQTQPKHISKKCD